MAPGPIARDPHRHVAGALDADRAAAGTDEIHLVRPGSVLEQKLSRAEGDRLEIAPELVGQRRILDDPERQFSEPARALGIEGWRKLGEQAVLAPDETVVEVDIDAEMGAGA